jgi:hypothetical protein
LGKEATVFTVALRDFQRQAGKALPENFYEPFLMQGRGEQFLAIRVSLNIPAELLDELQGFAAIAALRENQARAVESSLDQLTMAEVEAEIKAARAGRKHGLRP